MKQLSIKADKSETHLRLCFIPAGRGARGRAAAAIVLKESGGGATRGRGSLINMQLGGRKCCPKTSTTRKPAELVRPNQEQRVLQDKSSRIRKARCNRLTSSIVGHWSFWSH